MIRMLFVVFSNVQQFGSVKGCVGMIMKEILIYTKAAMELETLMLFLRGEGCFVDCAGEEREVIRQLSENVFHVLLIDSRGREKECFRLIMDIRKTSTVPILVISAKNTEQTVVEALNAGADDFVVYPIHVQEVAARVHSQIRRYTQLTNLCENINHIYRIRDLVVDDVKRKVTVGKKEVRLTPIEYKILKLLVQEKGKVFSIDQIYETIWNMQAIGVDNTIAVHIRHIREKIEENPREPEYLKVVWGTGYKVG